MRLREIWICCNIALQIGALISLAFSVKVTEVLFGVAVVSVVTRILVQKDG